MHNVSSAKGFGAVAELDEADESDLPHESAAPDQPIHARLLLSWTAEKAGETSQRSVVTTVRLTLDEALLHLPLTGDVARNRVTLLKMFSTSLARQFKHEIEAKASTRVVAKFDANAFARLLELLENSGFIESAPPPPYVKQAGNYWKLTPQGIRHIAKLTSPSNDQK